MKIVSAVNQSESKKTMASIPPSYAHDLNTPKGTAASDVPSRPSHVLPPPPRRGTRRVLPNLRY